MTHAPRPKRQVLLAAALLLAAFGGPASAQSGAEANAWAAWCREQGGTVVVTASSPYCEPPTSSGSGGYTASEQAMLDLAGQLGYALGSAIRQSFQESARQAEINRMQRAWEAEQARQRAAQALEERRRRNQALLSNMQGAIGQNDLSLRGVGSGELRLRTTEEMFDAPPSEVASAGAPAADAADAAWQGYLAALQSHDDARAALAARQAALAVGNQIANAAAREAIEQRARVEATAAGSEERRLEEIKLADAERRFAEAVRLRDQAQAEVDAAGAEASRAGQALAAAEAQRMAASGDSSASDASSASAPNTDTSVVDLRAPGVSLVDPGDTDFSVVDARGPIGEQYANLPRLEEIENSPARPAWLRGMDAIANSDYELAVGWFRIAQQNDPSNPALARAIDGTTFVRDWRRRRAAGVPEPAPALPASSGQAVDPTEADMEFMREEMTAEAQRLWVSLNREEIEQARVLDLEDELYNQLLFDMMMDGR